MTEPALSLKATGRSRRRLLVNKVAEGAAMLAAVLAVGALALVVWAVFIRGVGALNLDFFIKGPPQFGESGGGIAPAIVGTLLLVAIATVIALPFGVLTALYVSEFAPERHQPADPALARRAQRLSLDRDRHLRLHPDRQGADAGPRLGPPPERDRRRFRTFDHHAAARRALDHGGARGWCQPPPRGKLCARRLQVADGDPGDPADVVRRDPHRHDARVARAAGETAPLLFTCAIAGQIVDWNPAHSVQSIPLTIFAYSESADPILHEQAWAAAFVLIVFVLVTSLTARLLLERSRRKLGLSR